MTTIQISNVHADAVGSYLTSLTPPRSWRVVERSGDHVEDVAWCETDASRDEVQAAMDHSVDLRGDRCSAIDWQTWRARLLAYDREHDVADPARDVVSPWLPSNDAALDWIARESGATRAHLVVRGAEIWVLGACAALAVIERDTATIAQPAAATMVVGTGDAKGMPPGLAEELAGMSPEDRAVARRVSDLGEVEPSPGYIERAAARLTSP